MTRKEREYKTKELADLENSARHEAEMIRRYPNSPNKELRRAGLRELCDEIVSLRAELTIH
jgi:hypothetical protein